MTHCYYSHWPYLCHSWYLTMYWNLISNSHPSYLLRWKEIFVSASLILEDLDTKKQVSRHLSDVYKLNFHHSYANLYKDTKKANLEEIEETFNNLPYDKLPIADGMTKLKLNETDGQKSDDENAVGHRMRLRPRKSKI